MMNTKQITPRKVNPDTEENVLPTDASVTKSGSESGTESPAGTASKCSSGTKSTSKTETGDNYGFSDDEYEDLPPLLCEIQKGDLFTWRKRGFRGGMRDYQPTVYATQDFFTNCRRQKLYFGPYKCIFFRGPISKY